MIKGAKFSRRKDLNVVQFENNDCLQDVRVGHCISYSTTTDVIKQISYMTGVTEKKDLKVVSKKTY